MIEFETKTIESPQTDVQTVKFAAMKESIAKVHTLLKAGKISPEDLYVAYVESEIAGTEYWYSRQTAPTAVALFQELCSGPEYALPW